MFARRFASASEQKTVDTLNRTSAALLGQRTLLKRVSSLAAAYGLSLRPFRINYGGSDKAFLPEIEISLPLILTSLGQIIRTPAASLPPSLPPRNRPEWTEKALIYETQIGVALFDRGKRQFNPYPTIGA
jgi:hypothetical protein